MVPTILIFIVYGAVFGSWIGCAIRDRQRRQQRGFEPIMKEWDA